MTASADVEHFLNRGGNRKGAFPCSRESRFLPTVTRKPRRPFITRAPPMSDRRDRVVFRAFSNDLEFRGRRRERDGAENTRVIASAYGVTSKISPSATPAHGQAVMFRTELPQASRVVSPVGKSAHRVLDLRERHVQLHVLPRGDVGEPARGLVATPASERSCAGRKDPLWNLHAQHVDSFGLTLPVGALRHKTELAPVLG